MSKSKYKHQPTLHQDPKTQQWYKIEIVTQATRVINAFGGPTKFREALANVGFEISYVQVMRWNHPREKGGCAGVIPFFNHQPIMQAAWFNAVPLSSDIFDPRPTRIRTNIYAKRANSKKGGRKFVPDNLKLNFVEDAQGRHVGVTFTPVDPEPTNESLPDDLL